MEQELLVMRMDLRRQWIAEVRAEIQSLEPLSPELFELNERLAKLRRTQFADIQLRREQALPDPKPALDDLGSTLASPEYLHRGRSEAGQEIRGGTDRRL